MLAEGLDPVVPGDEGECSALGVPWRVLVELGRAAIIFGGSKASDKIHRILESRAAEALLCCCFLCLTFISHTLLRTFRGPGVICSPKEN